MRTTIIATITLALGFAGAWMIFADNQPPAAASATAAQQYTCGMHPQIVTNEPGYCPICGMKLTPKKDGASEAGTISIDPTTTKNMGIATTEVRRQTITRTVRTFGKVKIAQPNEHAINVKFDGWVEKLYVDREGEQVFKGQPLFDVYSPELVAAQKEYLIALRGAGGQSSGLLTAARARLANWDISDDQIDELTKSGEATRTLKVRAPIDGIVTMKNVAQGEMVKPDMEAYRVADLSSVWVVAQVYEQDLPFVHMKQDAQVAFPNLGTAPRTGTVSYIAPYLDERGQVEVRVVLSNPDLRLKPEMYAEVSLASSLPGERLAVPRTAVINSGIRQLAYVELGDGKFEPREIKVGAAGDGDQVEIQSGLSEGERVVVTGQFMLDSETRLNESLTQGGMPGHDHGSETAVESKAPPPVDTMGGHDMTSHTEDNPDELVATGGHDIYTCPMPAHYGVLQYGPGKCPQCGMDLVPLAQTTNTKVYVCPMVEDQIVQDHPGACPKCHMNLVRYRAEASDDK